MERSILRAIGFTLNRILGSAGVATYKTLSDAYPVARTGIDPGVSVRGPWARAEAGDAGDLSIVGGEYQLWGGEWTDSAGTISEGDLVRIRLTSSLVSETEAVATLTADTNDYVLSVTTREVCYLLDGDGDPILDGSGNQIEVPCE